MSSSPASLAPLETMRFIGGCSTWTGLKSPRQVLELGGGEVALLLDEPLGDDLDQLGRMEGVGEAGGN